MVESEFHVAQFLLVLPIFLIVFGIRWGFVNWILDRGIIISLIVSLILSSINLFIGLILIGYFQLLTYDPEHFVLKFSMGIEGFSNLFWFMLFVWFFATIIDLAILKPFLPYLIAPPYPHSQRMVVGLLWANFFSAPLITLLVWLFQFN